jgi:hypothetical protein
VRPKVLNVALRVTVAAMLSIAALAPPVKPVEQVDLANAERVAPHEPAPIKD